MERKSKKVVSVLMVSIALICVAIITGISILSTKILVDNNKPTNELLADNSKLTSDQIIVQACKLLGTKYAFGNKGASGIYGTPSKPFTESQVKNLGIDCSGLIYWTLSSLGQSTQGFGYNNPVPVDTFHWLQYWTGSTRAYWSECTNTTGVGNKSAKTANLTINGNKVEVLKAEDQIGDLRYYEYGQKGQYLPAGTIVISNGKALGGKTLSDGTYVGADEVEDHSWITLGYLDTTNPDDVINYLVSLGVPRENLIAGTKDANGNITPSNANVVKESDSCRYWRIESTANNGLKGVYINNADAEIGVSRYSASQGKYVKKAVGPVWAFKIAEEEKNGDFQLSVFKTDENKQPILLDRNVFKITDISDANNRHEATCTISSNNSSRVMLDKVNLDSTHQGRKYTYLIEETEAPAGYEKYNNLIKVEITARYDANFDRMIGTVTGFWIGPNENSLVQQQIGLQGEFQYDGGKVDIQYLNGVINVKVKNTKLTGDYKLSIHKTDSTGNAALNGSKFEIKKANGDRVELSGNQALFETNKIEINSVEAPDVYEVKETVTPEGYQSLDKKIVLQVNKAINGNKYVISNVNVYAFDENEEYNVSNLSSENLVGTINNENKATTYNNEGKSFSIELSNDNSTINVFVQNKYVDLALKKTITKVENNNVTTANGFNTGRYVSELENVATSLTADGVDVSTLSSSTNATYYMNKKPVEVVVGEKIEYAIKIFNEGQVNARASKIADYIPKGLRVIGVKYAGQDLTSYTYDEAHRVLTIDLTEKGSLINAFNKETQTISKDEVTVICEVENDATGILTNVAEITEYMDESGVIENDVDSTPSNWTAPNGENKLENTKDSTPWRNYNTNPSATDWSDKYLAQDGGLNSNKGDDDDFDKVVVVKDEEITLTINKVNENDRTQGVNDVLFNITKQYEDEAIEEQNNVALTNAKLIETQNVSGIKANTIVYTMQEVENNNYIQLDGTIRLEIRTEAGKITSYLVSYKGKDESNYTLMTPNYVNDASRTIKLSSSNGYKFDVTFEKSDRNINVIIPNKPIENSSYGLRLRKISSSDGRGLQGVTFTSTFNSEAIAFDATDANGYTNQITKNITIDNYETTDQFEISEINLGANAGFTRLTTPINVKVSKELTKEGQLKLSGYEITVDGKSTTINNKITERNIAVTDANSITYSINAKMETVSEVPVLTLTVPNAPDQTIKLQLIKINSRTNESIQGTGYSVYKYNSNRLVYKGQDLTGVQDISDSVEAGDRTAEYEIYEDYAAAGYINSLSGKMVKLTATFTDGVPQTAEVKVLNSDRTEASAEDQDLASVVVEGGIVKITIKNAPVQKKIDLALKKVITKVDGHEVKANSTINFEEIFERTTQGKMRIDTTPLKNGGHDAEYYLNKTPILVLRGSKITYEIRIYNEGEEDATAAEITDYLAPYMTLNSVSYKGIKLTEGNGYTYNQNTHVLKINVLEDEDLIEKYDATEDKLHMDYVTVECTVTDEAKEILTNVAQISKYVMNDYGDRVEVSKDVDSESGNWVNKLTDKVQDNETVDRTMAFWQNYTGDLIGPRRNQYEEGAFKNYLGEEDDDDFEKVKVAEIDLVLKKVITKVNDTPEERFGADFVRFQEKDGERKVVVDVRALNRVSGTTTAEYYLNKTPVAVKVGDTVTYQLRIYNEGSIDATASEIKDYIPLGLKFDSIYLGDSEEALTSGYSYNENTNVLTITALKDNFIERYKGGRLDYQLLDPSYKYVTVKCKVTGDRKGLLTNVAEISKYETIYGETTEDRDSQTTGDGEWQAPTGTDKNTKEGKSGDDWADYHNAIEEGEFENYPGQQDDDDFEKLVVYGYNFKVHKYSDWAVNGLRGAKFEINGEQYVTDENGNIDLGWFPLTYAPTGAGMFTVKELEAEGHRTIDEDIVVSLAKNNNPEITGINMTVGTKQYSAPSTLTAWYGDQRIVVDVNSKGYGNYEVTLSLPNRHDKVPYDLYVKKVDSNNSNIGINGSKFDVTPLDVIYDYDSNGPWGFGRTNQFVTSENGSVKIGRFTLNKNIWFTQADETKDIFKLEETETSENYYKIAENQDIYLTVNKNMVYDEQGNTSKLSVESIKLTLNKDTSSQVETENGRKVTLKNVALENDGLTVDVTAEITDVMDETTGKTVPTIVITVPNIEKKFDLALRKYITNVENTKESTKVNRWSEPAVEIESLIQSGTAKYNNAKDPIQVHLRDTVLYGINIYNEGEKDGYAQLVLDDVPEGLEMIAPGDGTNETSKVNEEYRWKMYRLATANDREFVEFDGVKYVETKDASEAKVIVTDYLSKEQGEARMGEATNATNPNLMKAFDAATMNVPMSRVVNVEFKVKTTNKENDIITNKAQIIKHSDKDGNETTVDRDSTPNRWIDGEDDQDVEHLIVLRDKLYDLALRKFITGVNNEALKNSREPKVDCSKLVKGGHDAEYYHSKEPVLVNTEDIVDYTLRIFNEGKDDAYASLVIDDVPEGLEMVLPEYDSNGKPLNLNAEYRWVMFKKVDNDELLTLSADNVVFTYNDETYLKTDKAEEAVLITTDYLSKENGEQNLLKAFNTAVGKMTAENYRDIKVQFKVITKEPEKLEINYAQIGKMTNDTGDNVEDIDSTPGVWIDGEDDQDIEVVKVGKFDLALYKWVTQAIVTENGKTTEYDSQHTQMDKSNMVNVSIPKNSLNKVTVKFKYQIKVENEGSIAGKALEIKDHIPAGLKFVAEDNTEFGWSAVDDRTIVTDYLKDTVLQPGESTEVTVVLTWINGSKNFGEKVNYAEISKDYNEYGWPDVDSTPDNFKNVPTEDDEDGDVVMLQIRTGIENVVYFVIAAVAMVIVAGGVVAIKKFVVNK